MMILAFSVTTFLKDYGTVYERNDLWFRHLKKIWFYQVFMRGSRKLYQRGSNFDKDFLLLFFFFFFRRERRSKQIPL